MSEKKYVYYVHGVNYNETADEQTFVVGYFTTLDKAEQAAEKYVEPEEDCSVAFRWYTGNKASEPYVVKYYSDQDLDSCGDEGIRIWVEAFTLDKPLGGD